MFSIIKLKIVGLVCLTLVAVSCQSRSKSSKRKIRKNQQTPAALSLDNAQDSSVSNTDPKSLNIEKNEPSLDTSKAPPLKKSAKVLEFRDNCHVLVKRFAPYYQDLLSSLAPHLASAGEPKFAKLRKMKPEHCDDEDQIKETLSTLREIATSHRTCAGLILPLTGSSRRATESILKGLRAAYSDSKGSSQGFESVFKIRDSSGSAATAKKMFADLTLSEQCSVISGGVEFTEASELIRLAQGVQQPLLVLSSRAAIPAEASSIFGLFPTESRLSEALVQNSAKKGIKKIAILRPSHGRADRLIDQFKSRWVSQGGSIIDDVTYTPSQFDSMQTAARRLFRTDIIGREAEYREAIQKAKKNAEKNNEKFNPKMVLLSPQVNFEALFLPDDFRTVRHMIKLIKYHMVSKLILIGHHEWRSQGLLNPPEPFLNGSFFVDFVPRYDQIPRSIPVALDGSPYFAQPQSAGQVDFQLIGYHVGKVILQALSEAPKNRLALIPQLLELKVKDSESTPARPVFDSGRNALWPTFAYQIEDGMIKSL